MSCPFEKVTSFGKEKGYTICLDPKKRFRHCNQWACERMESEEATKKTVCRPTINKPCNDFFDF